MGNVSVCRQTLVGGLRHKPAIGAVVFAVGAVWLALAGRAAGTAPSVLIGLGAGIVLLTVGTR